MPFTKEEEMRHAQKATRKREILTLPESQFAAKALRYQLEAMKANPQNPKGTEVSTTVPLSPITSPGIVAVKTSSNLAPVATCIGAAISTFLVILVVALVFGDPRTHPSVQNISSFCCDDEALMMMRIVNASADPCEDFYAHVCSRADAGAPEYLSPMFRIAMIHKLVELNTERPGRSAAGSMLAALRKPTRKEDELFGENIAELVEAIAEAAAIDKNTEPSHIVRLFAEVSFRYGLPSVVSFTVSGNRTVLTIRKNDGCVLSSDFADDVGAAVDAFNKALNETVTVQQLQRLQGQLPATQSSEDSKVVSFSIDQAPFSSLSGRQWKALTQDLIIPLHPNVTTIETREGDRLNDFFGILEKVPDRSITSAYTVICTAFMTRDKLYNTLPADASKGMGISCDLLGVCEIEDVFFAEMINSRLMDKYVRGLFAQIRLNVILQAASHPVLGGTSREEIAQELNKLRLILPEEIITSDILVPNVSETFVSNLLAARSYVFDVRKAKMERKVPDSDSLSSPAVVRNGDVIYVPTNVYALLGKKPNRVAALGIPVVGVDFAAEMWSFLLEHPWPKETREKIHTSLECIANEHSHHNQSLRTAALALGVVSATDAMMTPEWDTGSIVNDTETSLGRLVYLKWAYDKCTSLQEQMTHFDVNLALRNSPQFAKVFGCSKNAAMAAPSCCFKSC